MNEDGRRGGWRRRYAVARDNYVFVFLLILFAIGITSATSGPGGAAVFATVVQSLALLLTLRTTGVRGRALNALRTLAVIPVLVALASLLVGFAVGPVYYGSMTLLIASTQAAIVVHALRRPSVSADTVVGALCVYLLLGLLFATLDAFYGSGGRVFFAQPGSHIAGDYVYFSFITLTTVGYGDLTPGPPTAHILAVAEALLGQLYLVTVISLLVGNLGAQRFGRHPGPKKG